MGRSDGAVHSLDEGTAQPGHVPQVLNIVVVIVAVVFDIRIGVGIVCVLILLRSGAGRGGLEATGVGLARGRAETGLDRRGLQVLPGGNIVAAQLVLLLL